jgi:hypothetical protein
MQVLLWVGLVDELPGLVLRSSRAALRASRARSIRTPHEPSRNVFGRGRTERSPVRPAIPAFLSAAPIMAKNAAGYMARNVAGNGRHYVSARLVRETGVTMRALRACNWLYVRRKLISAGELDDEWIPGHWTAELDRAGARGAGGGRSPPRPLAPRASAAAATRR